MERMGDAAARLQAALHPRAGIAGPASTARSNTCPATPKSPSAESRAGPDPAELAVLLSTPSWSPTSSWWIRTCRRMPTCRSELGATSPNCCRKKYAKAMQEHRLKREIIATAVTNSTINRMGATFCCACREDSSRSAGGSRQGLHHHPRDAGRARVCGRPSTARRSGRRVGAGGCAAGDLEHAAQLHPLAAGARGAIPRITTAVERYHDIRRHPAAARRTPDSQRPGYEASPARMEAEGRSAETRRPVSLALPYLRPCRTSSKRRARTQAQADRRREGLPTASPRRCACPWLQGADRRRCRWKAAGTRSARRAARRTRRADAHADPRRCSRRRARTPATKCQHWLHCDDATLRFTWRCWLNSPRRRRSTTDRLGRGATFVVFRVSRPDAFPLLAKLQGEDPYPVVRRVCLAAG